MQACKFVLHPISACSHARHLNSESAFSLRILLGWLDHSCFHARRHSSFAAVHFSSKLSSTADQRADDAFAKTASMEVMKKDESEHMTSTLIMVKKENNPLQMVIDQDPFVANHPSALLMMSDDDIQALEHMDDKGVLQPVPRHLKSCICVLKQFSIWQEQTNAKVTDWSKVTQKEVTDYRSSNTSLPSQQFLPVNDSVLQPLFSRMMHLFRSRRVSS